MELGAHALRRYAALRRSVDALRASQLDAALFGLLLSAESARDELREFEAQRSALLRLSQTGHLVRRLQRLHGALDAALAVMEDDEPVELSEWEKPLQDEREERVRRYRELLELWEADEELLREEIETEAQQEQALVLLKAGLDGFGSDVMSPQEEEVIKRAFRMVAEQANAVVVTNPEWLATPFEFGGTFGLSRWGNDLYEPEDANPEQFTAEASLWSKLNHPHIAKFLGACHVRARGFVAHEKVRSLAEYVSNVADRGIVWRRLYEVGLGLQYLHERGLACTKLDVDSVFCAQMEDKALLLGANLIEMDQSSPEKKADESTRARFVTANIHALALLILNIFHEMSPLARMHMQTQRGKNREDKSTVGVIDSGSEFDTFPEDRPESISEDEWTVVQDLHSTTLDSPGGVLHAIKKMRELGNVDGRRGWIDESGILESHSDLSASIEDVGQIEIPALRMSIERSLSRCGELVVMDPLAVSIQLRLDDIYNQIENRVQSGTAVAESLEVTARFSSVVVKFYRFLQQAYNSNASSQLGMSRRVPSTVFGLHMEIDRLIKAENLASIKQVHAWQPEWFETVASQRKASSSKSPGSSLSSKMPIREDEEEVSAYAEFEATCRDISESTSLSVQDPRLTASLSNLGKLPKWFVPPYEVDFQSYDAFSQGSFGSVHHGKWFDTRVVVKQVFMDSVTHSDVRAQFLREADIWFMLNHVNVVKMYGGCHVGQPFFICEYASGGDLDSFLNHKGRDPYLIWYTLLNAALGLQYLHDTGVVHGDLKGNNILVGSDGAAKLADFGLSVLKRSGSSNETGGAVGAYRWKAPECIPTSKTPGKFATCASDVYSFAMCIIEVVGGEFPWGSVPDAVVSFYAKKGRLPPRPKEMEDSEWKLIERMCCLDPTQRETIDAVVVHLSALIEKMDLARFSLPAEERLASRSFQNQVVSRGGALFGVLSLVKSNNEALARYAAKHLSTIHLNRGARSEKREIEEIVKLLISTGSVGRHWAADALTTLTSNNVANRLLIAEAGAVEPLISLLSSGSNNGKLYAISALSNLAIEKHSRKQIGRAIPAFVEFTRNGDESQQERAATAIWHLCIEPENQTAAADAGAIDALTDLLKSGNDSSKAKAAGAIWNMAANEQNKAIIAGAGAIVLLTNLVRNGTPAQKGNAMSALCNLALREENIDLVAQGNFVSTLTELLQDENEWMKQTSSNLLFLILLEPRWRVPEEGSGTISPLIKLLDDQNGMTKANALSALCALAMDEKCTKLVRDAVGFEPMNKLILWLQDTDCGPHEFVASNLIEIIKGGAVSSFVDAGGLEAAVDVFRANDARGRESAATIVVYAGVLNPTYIDKAISAGVLDDFVSILRSDGDPLKDLCLPFLIGVVANPTYREAKVFADVIGPLVNIIRDGNEMEQCAAIQVLGMLASIQSHCEAITATGVVSALVALIKEESDLMREAVSMALWNLSVNPANKKVIPDSGGIDLIVEMVQNGTEGQKLNALGILANLAVERENQSSIAAAGGIELIVDLLETGNDPQKSFAALAVLFLAANAANQARIVTAGAIPLLVSLISSGSDEQSIRAIGALGNLAASQDNRGLMVGAGAIPVVLVAIKTGNNFQSGHAAYALGNLALDKNSNKLIEEAGGIPLLAQLAKDGDDFQKGRAVFALWKLAYRNESDSSVIKSTGGIGTLLELAQCSDLIQKQGAVGALAHIDTTPDEIAIAANNCAVLLTDLLKGTDEVKEMALESLLFIFSRDPGRARKSIFATNGESALSELAQSKSSRVNILASKLLLEIQEHAAKDGDL